MAVRIRVNGKEYGSTDALPEGIRQAVGSALEEALADADGDGVPDVVAKGGGGPAPVRRYVYQGRIYDDPAELPPGIRAAMEGSESAAPIRQDGRPTRALTLAVAVALLAAGAVYLLASSR